MSPPQPPRLAAPVVAPPGLAFPRLLSSAEISPLDTVAWTLRDLRGLVDDDRIPRRALEEIAVPVDWSGRAAGAFLRSHVTSRSTLAREGQGLDVRGALRQTGIRLRDQGLAGGYFVRSQDATIFADELTCLLLSQRAAFAAAEFTLSSRSASSPAGPGRRLTPETPGLGDIFAKHRVPRNGAAPLELLLSQELLEAAHGDRGQRGVSARDTLDRVAQSVLDGAAPVLHLTETNLPGSLLSGEPSSGGTAAGPAATLNLARFLAPNGSFDLALFSHAVQLLTTALEISIVGRSSEAAATVAQPSRRPLALGFANLGAMLMESGLPYDAGLSRSIAGAIAGLLCGEALAQSARIAETCPPADEGFAKHDQTRPFAAPGACEAFRRDPATSLSTLRQLRAATFRPGGAQAPAPAQVAAVDSPPMSYATFRLRPATAAIPSRPRRPTLSQQLPDLVAAARSAWDRALTGAELFGLRNMEVTALNQDQAAAAALDCDTMGIAPADSLVEAERRTATGQLAVPQARRAVRAALFRLGYTHTESGEILAAIEHTGDLSRADRLRPEHRIIFLIPAAVHPSPKLHNVAPDEAASTIGTAAILRMFAAVQPFLMHVAPLQLTLPRATSPAQIVDLLQQGSQLGIPSIHLRMLGARTHPGPAPARPLRVMSPKDRLPAIANATSNRIAERGSRLRRDHVALLDMQLARTAQTLAESEFSSGRRSPAREAAARLPSATRSPLPPERASVTHVFAIAGQHGTITVSLYPDGLPGEIVIRMQTGGAALTGLLDALSAAISLAMQHGVPLRSFAEHLLPTHFEPAGKTANPQIPYARSIVDYLFRWLELRFLSTSHLLPGE